MKNETKFYLTIKTILFFLIWMARNVKIFFKYLKSQKLDKNYTWFLMNMSTRIVTYDYANLEKNQNDTKEIFDSMIRSMIETVYIQKG